MKTFRWTVPEPPLSAAELRAHESALNRRSIPEPSSSHDDLCIEPVNWRERWALHQLRQNSTKWSFLWILFYPLFLTWLWHDGGDNKQLLVFVWIVAVFMMDNSIRGAALRKILIRQITKPNGSEQATLGKQPD